MDSLTLTFRASTILRVTIKSNMIPRNTAETIGSANGQLGGVNALLDVKTGIEELDVAPE